MIKAIVLSLCLMITCSAVAEKLTCANARLTSTRICSIIGKKRNHQRCVRAMRVTKSVCKSQKNLPKKTDLGCPKNIASVCAQPPMPKCPEGVVCAQVMPQPKIYQNACLAAVDNAKEIEMKYCAELGE
jgi:hypothetical protein